MKKPDRLGYQLVRRDLHFTDAIQFADATDKPIKNADVRRVAEAYRNYVRQIKALAYVPMSVADAAARFLLPFTEAVFNTTGKPVLEDADVGTVASTAIGDEYASIISDTNYYARKEKTLQMYVANALVFNKMTNIDNSFQYYGYVALLGAQISSIWTAFNTLTADLWKAAVNQCPKLAMTFQAKVSVVDLEKYGFNIQDRMGDLLQGEFDFGKFEHTKNAYEAIFPNQKRVHIILARERLSDARLVRNCIVHDSSKADEEFVAAAKTEPWNKLKAGDELPLDGRSVCALTSAVVECGNDLLTEIDTLVEKSK